MANVKHIDKVTVFDIINEPYRYGGLVDGLVELPCPDLLTIDKKQLTVPKDLETFSGSICYGQRMYFGTKDPNQIATVIRYGAGYYSNIYSGKPWSEDDAMNFGVKILTCRAKEVFPVSFKLLNLMLELVEREKKLLHREPTKQERAAGIEKLEPFSELAALLFLADSFKITEEQVLLKKYDDCLVRFMYRHQQDRFADRLQEVYRKEAESKTKGKGKKK